MPRLREPPWIRFPQIQYLLKQNIDVLVVIPQDKALLGGVIQKTLDRNIPVLSYDRPIMDVPITGYISFDNHEVGRLLSSALLSRVPTGNYIIVNGSIHDNNSFQVNNGVHEVLDPFIEKGDINLVEEIWLENWSYDEALRKSEKSWTGPKIFRLFRRQTTSSPRRRSDSSRRGSWQGKLPWWGRMRI